MKGCLRRWRAGEALCRRSSAKMFFSFSSKRKEPKECRPGQSRPDVHRDALAADKKPGPADALKLDTEIGKGVTY